MTQAAAKPLRLMPDKLHLGKHAQTTMGHAMHHWRQCVENPEEYNPFGRRAVMGFPLPDWQRPLVWTDEQQRRFIESAWLGLNLGTYTYNQVYGAPEFDGLLIDGQRRLWAVERYLSDAFPAFDHRWSEITDVDRRGFEMSVLFPCYITESTDEKWLRNYYNLMNFGGTAHSEDQRA